MSERTAAPRAREQRFTRLFSECYGPVLAFARRRLDPELAQDVVAETFLTAWRRLDDLTGEPLPWLYPGTRWRTSAGARSAASAWTIGHAVS